MTADRNTFPSRAALALIASSILSAGVDAQIKFMNDAKTYSIKMGGRIHNDWALITADIQNQGR